MPSTTTYDAPGSTAIRAGSHGCAARYASCSRSARRPPARHRWRIEAMDHARERSSKERAERNERDGRARTAAAHTGPALMAPGLGLDGIGNRALLALLRSGQLQRKARVAEPSDPREH